MLAILFVKVVFDFDNNGLEGEFWNRLIYWMLFKTLSKWLNLCKLLSLPWEEPEYPSYGVDTKSKSVVKVNVLRTVTMIS